MRAALSILFTAAVFAPTAARADQCQLVDSQIATKAVELARKSASVIHFCEPCRGGVKRGPFTLGKVEIRDRQVEINGKAVDLAYTFIHVKGDEYTNLGLAAGCSAKGVSQSIRSSQPAQSPPPAPPPLPNKFTTRPPMPRVTSPDDIGGTWDVTIRSVVSTCAAPAPATRTAKWTISVANGSLSLMTEQGREMIAPVPALDRFNNIRVDLKDRHVPQAGVIQVTQSLKDNFWGRLLHVEKGCAITFDVMGKRVP